MWEQKNVQQQGCCPTNECWNGEKCINSGEIVNDYYCDDGTMKSKPRLIAEKLLDMVNTDYVLFCDTYTNASICNYN